VPLERLLADPVQRARELGGAPHPGIPLPPDLYGPARRNSSGLDLSDPATLIEIAPALQALGQHSREAQAVLAWPDPVPGTPAPCTNPADRRDRVGTVRDATPAQVEAALAAAAEQAPHWQAVAPAVRAAMLERAAALLERERLPLVALAVREAGKTLPNAVAEVREAVDFLRYYAAGAGREAARPALGPVACISPWNFPLAIFLGQVGAALAAGNVVVAKPAEQTPLIAHYATLLLHEAGVPAAALQLLPGRGETVGAALVSDPRIRGVLFTGSTAVALSINRTLAGRGALEGRALPLVAETGGQNAMIVDSSALPEQVVQDVLASAFDSAGQRCSALRVLCLQEDIAERVLRMLRGAMRELRVGAPDRLATDVGPVIDDDALAALNAAIGRARDAGWPVFQLPLDAACGHGSFVPPTLVEIPDLGVLGQEVFGPVLHVLRFRRGQLARLVGQINASGFGLTLGIHSRIDETVDAIASQAHVGNVYVNRNMVGAVVGVQPFGGEGKSGTGPKAGGPLYLRRLQQGSDSGLGPRAQNEAADPALLAFGAWAAGQGDTVLQAVAALYAQESLAGRALVLPGPTGETNRLRFEARGRALCAANTRAGLLNQLAAALATGNQAIVMNHHAVLLPPALPALVLARLGVADTLASADIDLALCESACCRELLPKLAARDGALLPVVQTDGSVPVALWRLVAERALCVNTAAAGGNASLMALAQE
jgi:RHH-type proline utilization regulon transcriptional repressor/proline dehydrogenase/delta 1-pyrroline-5-carboxylate dehydrogenase